MNPFIREKICFYSSPFVGRSSSFEIVKYAAKVGVGGIEFMNFSEELSTPDMKVARELGKFAKDAGLKMPCFSAGIKIAGENKDKNLADLKKYAEICSELEIPYLHHTVYCNFLKTDMGAGFEQTFADGVESSLIINEYAAKLGVQTLVEDQGFIFNGIENYRRFMDATEWKIGTVLDIGNIMFYLQSAEDFCDAFGENVRHVHVKDFKYVDSLSEDGGYGTIGEKFLQNVPLGQGDVNLPAVADSLKRINYDGFYAMECAPTDDDNEAEIFANLELTAKMFG